MMRAGKKHYYKHASSARRALRRRGIKGGVIFHEIIKGEHIFMVWL